MKRMPTKLFLTSLAIAGSSLAQAEQLATAPTLEGGLTAFVGTWYASANADNQDYGIQVTDADDPDQHQQVLAVNPDYDFGFQAALGYIF